MDKKPKIPITLTTIDYFLEVIGGIGVICMIVLPIYFFNDLPAQIPKHFNALGQPDSYGNRGIIWLLPAIGLVLYAGLTILSRFPHLLNYPVKITSNNAERLYTLGTRTIRLLKVIVVVAFAFLNFRTIEIALNITTQIGAFYVPVFLVAMTVIIGVMFYKMVKK